MTAGKKYALYRGMPTGKDDFLLEKAIITGVDGNHRTGGVGLYVMTNASVASDFAFFNRHEAGGKKAMVVEFEVALDGTNWRIDFNREATAVAALDKSMNDLMLSLPPDIRNIIDDAVSLDNANSSNPFYRKDQFLNLLQQFSPEEFAAANLKVITEMLEHPAPYSDGCLRYIGKDPLPVNRIFVLNEESKEFELVYDRSQPTPRQPAAKTTLAKAVKPPAP